MYVSFLFKILQNKTNSDSLKSNLTEFDAVGSKWLILGDKLNQ